jgi:hypothetical protein
MKRIGRIGKSERLGGYGGRKGWEVRKLKRFERLGRSKIFGG